MTKDELDELLTAIAYWGAVAVLSLVSAAVAIGFSVYAVDRWF
jgi:hypothetical protein